MGQTSQFNEVTFWGRTGVSGGNSELGLCVQRMWSSRGYIYNSSDITLTTIFQIEDKSWYYVGMVCLTMLWLELGLHSVATLPSWTVSRSFSWITESFPGSTMLTFVPMVIWSSVGRGLGLEETVACCGGSSRNLSVGIFGWEEGRGTLKNDFRLWDSKDKLGRAIVIVHVKVEVGVEDCVTNSALNLMRILLMVGQLLLILETFATEHTVIYQWPLYINGREFWRQIVRSGFGSSIWLDGSVVLKVSLVNFSCVVILCFPSKAAVADWKSHFGHMWSLTTMKDSVSQSGIISRRGSVLVWELMTRSMPVLTHKLEFKKAVCWVAGGHDPWGGGIRDRWQELPSGICWAGRASWGLGGRYDYLLAKPLKHCHTEECTRLGDGWYVCPSEAWN